MLHQETPLHPSFPVTSSYLPLYSGCGGVGGACLFEVRGVEGVCVRACVRGCGMHLPLSEVRLFLGNICLALREREHP